MAGEAQREALIMGVMARLTGDAALAALATGGVHLVRAPQGTTAPYVTVRTYPGRIVPTISRGRAARMVRFAVVARVKGAGSITAERIDERVHELLSDHLPTLVNGYTCMSIRRELDINEPVVDEGVEYDQIGGMYAVWVSGGTG